MSLDATQEELKASSISSGASTASSSSDATQEELKDDRVAGEGLKLEGMQLRKN